MNNKKLDNARNEFLAFPKERIIKIAQMFFISKRPRFNTWPIIPNVFVFPPFVVAVTSYYNDNTW